MLSVGDILKKKREEKGLTLAQVEKSLRVRQKFLSYIERNDWSHFSSKIYIEGIIKNYARLLGVEPQKALAFFRRDFEKKEDVKFKRRVSHKYLTSQGRKARVAILLVICLLFIGYFAYQLTLYLSPPKVEILAPLKSTFKRETRIDVKGKTEKEAKIMIFGERVYPDNQGVFEYQLPLKQGKNTLKIEVTGANGKKTTLTKEFVNK